MSALFRALFSLAATSHQSVKKAGAFVHPISVGDDDDNTHIEEEEAEEEEGLEKKESYVGATLIIGGLIIMPLIVMVLVLVFLRCRHKGFCSFGFLRNK